jgi:hypothetical protein
MDFKFFMAVMIFATAPILAVAQSDDTKNHAPKPTMEDVQKMVQAISVAIRPRSKPIAIWTNSKTRWRRPRRKTIRRQ